MTDALAVTLLKGLAEKYSPTGQEEGAVAFLQARMQAMGFVTWVDEAGNACGSIGQGDKEIILLGHIDTVPGEIPVQIDDEILRGRGAVDAKGPLACFTMAAAIAGAQPGWKLTVIGAVAEEGDSHGAKHLCGRPAPVYTIIGEPSGWERITLGYKGSAWLRYTVSRSLTHTAAEIESASEAAVGFWNALKAKTDVFNRERSLAFERLIVTLREMNSSLDGFSERAELKIGMRLPPDVAVAQAAQMFSDELNGGELKLLDGIECYKADKNTPLVHAFLAAIREEGGKPGFLLKTGTSDMNIVGPAWNCPILAYGPGDSSLDHTPQEHIRLPEYLAGIRVLTGALKQLMRS